MLPFVRELARMLQEQLGGVLARPVNREALLAATDASHRFYETTWASIQQLHSVPHACASGCAHCCYLTVEASAPSVFLIAEYLRATRTPLELKRIKAHLRQTVARIGGMSAVERIRAVIPCALLKDNRCSVYAVRPPGCRCWNSRDADACARLLSEGGGDLRPVQDQRPFGITSGVHAGFTAALKAAGLPQNGEEHYELNAALLIALENPRSVQQWLDGESTMQAS
jgi:hypothetical protein